MASVLAYDGRSAACSVSPYRSGLNPSECCGLDSVRCQPGRARVIKSFGRCVMNSEAQPLASDIMPVAALIWHLQKRYNCNISRSVCQNRTIIRTDGGASALVGQMQTRAGETLLFVIFNQRGNVIRFRENQDALVWQMQSLRGGPSPFNYRPLTLAMRLADTKQDSAMPARKDEYEPAQ